MDGKSPNYCDGKAVLDRDGLEQGMGRDREMICLGSSRDLETESKWDYYDVLLYCFRGKLKSSLVVDCVSDG